MQVTRRFPASAQGFQLLDTGVSTLFTVAEELKEPRLSN